MKTSRILPGCLVAGLIMNIGEAALHAPVLGDDTALPWLPVLLYSYWRMFGRGSILDRDMPEWSPQIATLTGAVLYKERN